jgi:tRNA(Ile)-lysidine synthase
MTGHKKLQDIFVDLKIPRSQRSTVPIVCAGGEAIWAVGVRADVRSRCVDQRRDRVLISARKLDGGETATIG